MKNKELILKQALSLFLKKGYKLVSIKDIIESCNLSKGAIYHHFESKEKILHEALEHYYFNALTIDTSMFEGHSFRKQIEIFYSIAVSVFEMFETIEEGGIEYPIKNFYIFQLECESFPEIREKFKNIANSYRKVVEDLVFEGLVKNELKKELDAETVSYQIVGIIEGLAIHHSTIKNDIKNTMTDKYKKIFDSYLDLICANEK